MRGTYPNQPVLRLELLLLCLVVVDQTKACAPSTTKDCPEAEGDYAALVSLVDLCKALAELRLGDVWAVGVEDIDDELTPCEKTVRDELAGSEGDGRSGVLEG